MFCGRYSPKSFAACFVDAVCDVSAFRRIACHASTSTLVDRTLSVSDLVLLAVGPVDKVFPRLAKRSFGLRTGNHGGRYINPHREAHRHALAPASVACTHDGPSQNEGQFSYLDIGMGFGILSPSDYFLCSLRSWMLVLVADLINTERVERNPRVTVVF